jgi:proline iminopeptidase
LLANLFPLVEPDRQGTLAVSGGHSLYYEMCGARDGLPVLFLHGGPGSSINPGHRRLFDPQAYRVLLFDQRGCGKSAPPGEVRHNTTADLVEDIDALRRHAEVERWLLFGGSWGSTLALAYAQAHPDRVAGLVLRGIFLGGAEETAWYVAGLRRFLPEAWHAFADEVNPDDADSLIAHYHVRVMSDDEEAAREAARRWAAFESAAMAVGETASASTPTQDPQLLARARVQLHYLAHGCFLQPGQLLRGLPAMAHLPGILVQGRRDLVCPPVTAYTLARAWPRAQLRIVEEAGHSALHPAMTAALMQATDDVRQQLRP